MDIVSVIGFLPAVIFPSATFLQLIHLVRTKSSEGVSAIAWIAFAVGNISMYVYTEKYTEVQSIVGMLFTCILQIIIVVLIFRYEKKVIVNRE